MRTRSAEGVEMTRIGGLSQLNLTDGFSRSGAGSLAPSVVTALQNRRLEYGEAVVDSAEVSAWTNSVGNGRPWRLAASGHSLEQSLEAERAGTRSHRCGATVSRIAVAADRPTDRMRYAALAPACAQANVERAARLLAACDAAVIDDGASISSLEADAGRELRRYGEGREAPPAVRWLR